MSASTSLKVWLHSLVAAAITGLASGITVSIADPAHFNGSPEGIFAILRVSAVNAILGVAAVLKQSPIPPSQAQEQK